jgi:multiple sugar transport system ATP-binding protein
MVAGLESITEGTITIGEQVVNGVPPKERDIAMVFQNYALYPHMTVFDNMGFGLKLRKLDKQEIDRRVREAADILGLEEFLERKPKALSGGQRQRVAMGRAIVREPKAFLMDEPLSNLDAKLRVQMRSEIARIQHDLNVTTMYVTHDQVEAMTMGDRVAVLKDGYLQQVDTPQNLYDEPTNVFVAAFIGSPSMNLYEGQLTLNGEGSVQIGPQRVSLPPECLARRPALQQYSGQRVIVGIRPEDFEDSAINTDAPADRRMKAKVRLVEALGSELMVHMELDDAKRVNSGDPDAPEELLGEGVANAVARFSPKSRVHVDDDVEVSIASENIHFFDSQSHAAIWS